MERSNIACQHWQSRRDEGGAESKSHQKDTDGRKRRAPAETRRRGGGKRENPVGAHRRGARLSARQRRQITSTDGCGKTSAIAPRAKGTSRMFGPGWSTVAKRSEPSPPILDGAPA